VLFGGARRRACLWRAWGCPALPALRPVAGPRRRAGRCVVLVGRVVQAQVARQARRVQQRRPLAALPAKLGRSTQQKRRSTMLAPCWSSCGSTLDRPLAHLRAIRTLSVSE